MEAITDSGEGRRDDRDMAANLTEEADSACSSSSRPENDLDPAHLNAIKPYIKHAYKNLRFFHGTNQSSLESIQSNGMSTALKNQGATVSSYGEDRAKNSKPGRNARTHNFITKDKNWAMMYANANTTDVRYGPRKSGADAVPKLARLFRTSSFPRIEKDPDSRPPFQDLSYRTRADIPRHSIRQEKGANRYSEEILAALQKNIIHHFRMPLSTREIERVLLNDVESDSDKDDFSKVDHFDFESDSDNDDLSDSDSDDFSFASLARRPVSNSEIARTPLDDADIDDLFLEFMADQES